MLGTVNSTSHQEDLVPRDVFVVSLLCFKPPLKWWAPHLPSLLPQEPQGNYCPSTTPIPVHPCTLNGATLLRLQRVQKGKKNARIEVTWVTLQHSDDKGLLCGSGAAWSECSFWGKRSKANLSLSLPIQCTLWSINCRKSSFAQHHCLTGRCRFTLHAWRRHTGHVEH